MATNDTQEHHSSESEHSTLNRNHSETITHHAKNDGTDTNHSKDDDLRHVDVGQMSEEHCQCRPQQNSEPRSEQQISQDIIDYYNSSTFRKQLDSILNTSECDKIRGYVRLLEQDNGRLAEERNLYQQMHLESAKDLVKVKHMCQELQERKDFYKRQSNPRVDTYDKDKDARELKQLRDRFQKLQDEALQSVDKFQSTGDEEISRLYSNLQLKTSQVASYLNKLGTSLSTEEWQTQIRKVVYPESVYFDQQDSNPSPKIFSKYMLINVIWTILDDDLFRSPFLCFPGDYATHAEREYAHLFEDPHSDPESAIWRSITAAKLTAKVDNDSKQKLMRDLFGVLASTIKSLGYDIQDSSFKKKAQMMIEAAMKFAQITAKERAIFTIQFCRVYKMDSEPNVKRLLANSETMKCVVEDEELIFEGPIWFMIEPALVKWGTGAGKNLDKWMYLVQSTVKLSALKRTESKD